MDNLFTQLTEEIGPIDNYQSLSHKVSLIRAGNQQFIVKKTSQVELYCYISLPNQIQSFQINFPRLVHSLKLNAKTIIVLEFIKPSNQNINQNELIQRLSEFHQTTLSNLNINSLATHYWQPEDNYLLLQLAPLSEQRCLRNVLDNFYYEFQHLFAPGWLITGDNCLDNWCCSTSGDVYRMDLEHVSLGSPAIDLACLQPNWPSFSECLKTADNYLKHNKQFKRNRFQLAADIVAATLWLFAKRCNTLLNPTDDQPIHPIISEARERLTTWLRGIFQQVYQHPDFCQYSL
ncbi:hypothetical protein KCM76_16090 [Zooshikella marina]|uniref:hypothetical protein n=1 Tax=Zooshikella ganghwensis TaxID=202772 RepID=UPI001BB0761E|nr:hypothetical protein [Zooshikella ganghwensis]MBU2707515.1 hypothetical protein [Zooshikella ganghwensis]